MADVIYTLDLAGDLWKKLKQINILNDEQLDKWSKVQTQVNAANKTMNTIGVSIGSLNERIAALKAQKEWIPANNREAIRATNKEIENLERQVVKLNALDGGGLKRWWKDLKAAVPALNLLTNPLTIAAAGTYKLNQFVGQSRQVYEQQAVSETKLAAVMRNTIGASNDEINSIKNLAGAQQKLGVISSGVQLAGAQELATYVSKKETLEKLMPAMNDMLAQQYGLSASQEQAAQIASMLGKVMDGQTGALSRYGYKFDKAQEKILKHGTEAQRAAVLYDVVTSAVGGVNEAIANTPEGKLKQQANNIGGLQGRIGLLATKAQAAFSPVIAKIGELMDKVVAFFERNSSKIEQIMQVIVKVVSGAIGTLWSVIKFAWDIFSGFINGIREGNPVFVGLAAVLAGVTTALILFKTWITIVSAGTMIWQGAQWLLNAALAANPIGVVIAIIVALIAVIAYVAYTTEGWGKTWNNVMTYMKLGFELFKESISLKWLEVQNFFISGFEIIEKGWYKLQSLWNKSAANEGLAKLEAQRNERLMEIAEAKNKVNDLKKQMAEMTVWEVQSNGKSLKDVVGSIKGKLGIEGGGNSQLQDLVNGRSSVNLAGERASTSAIATGGTRNTQITIHMGKFFDNIVFNGGFAENAKDIERKIEECMLRVLYSAQNAG